MVCFEPYSYIINYSCRRIDSKLNVFSNIWANKFFLVIFAICVAGQALIVNFGGAAFQVTPIDGEHWAISVVLGLLALPIGVVIRLLPDSLFSWIIRSPSARERYLGSHQGVPAMYMAGNERLSWSQTYDNVQQGISTIKSKDQQTSYPTHLSKQSSHGAIAASVMLPSMVATAPSTGWSGDDHEQENQHTHHSRTSRTST